MSKIYVTNNTGSLQTLNNADDDKVKVYNSLEDVDTSVLEEGEIIAVKDEAIDTSDIADTIIENATAEIDNLIANSGVPAGTIMSIKSNATLNGWLPCDGSTFDKTEYPFLYAALGNSNKLPISYNKDSLPEKPQVAIQNRSDYIPVGWTYGGTNPTWIPTIQEFTADGFLYIQADDYCYLWIQDSDGTIHGYMAGDRDNTENYLWVPIKKGGKIYGLNRNGGSTPAPSTEIANYDYTKIAIYYYTEFNYIRALSGVETAEESQTVVNAIAQAEASLETLIEGEIGDYAKDAVSDAVSDWVDVTSDFTFTEVERWSDGFPKTAYWNKSLKQLRIYSTSTDTVGANNNHSFKIAYNGSDTDINFNSPTLFITQNKLNGANNQTSAGLETSYAILNSGAELQLNYYNRNSSTSWPTNTTISAKIEF